MLPTITHGQGVTIVLAQAVSWWGERCKNVSSAKMWALVPISLPLTPSTCAGSYSFPDHHFPGLMAEQVKMPENSLEASLRLTAPEDPKEQERLWGGQLMD